MSIYKKKCYTDQKKLEQVNIFTFLRSFFIKWYFSIKNKYYLAIYCPIFDQGSTPPPLPHPFLSHPAHLWRSHSCTIVFDYQVEGPEHRITISLLLIYEFLFVLLIYEFLFVLLICLSFCEDIWTMFLFKKYWLFFQNKVLKMIADLFFVVCKEILVTLGYFNVKKS